MYRGEKRQSSSRPFYLPSLPTLSPPSSFPPAIPLPPPPLHDDERRWCGRGRAGGRRTDDRRGLRGTLCARARTEFMEPGAREHTEARARTESTKSVRPGGFTPRSSDLSEVEHQSNGDPPSSTFVLVSQHETSHGATESPRQPFIDGGRLPEPGHWAVVATFVAAAITARGIGFSDAMTCLALGASMAIGITLRHLAGVYAYMPGSARPASVAQRADGVVSLFRAIRGAGATEELHDDHISILETASLKGEWCSSLEALKLYLRTTTRDAVRDDLTGLGLNKFGVLSVELFLHKHFTADEREDGGGGSNTGAATRPLVRSPFVQSTHISRSRPLSNGLHDVCIHVNTCDPESTSTGDWICPPQPVLT